MNPTDDGYREATENERQQWMHDGILLGYQIVIAPQGVLWIKKETSE